MNWLLGLLSIGVNIAQPSGRAPAAGREPGKGGQPAEDWVSKARRISSYRSGTNAGAKYKPNDSEKELIGVQDAVLFWASELGVDNSTDDAGNSGLHLSIFDTTTRADSAQVELLNDSGDTQYIVAAAIKAKPIVRLSGEQGFTHDAFVDYQDIFLSGENQFEFGNNFVVTKTQLEQLADYYAKSLGVIVGDSAAVRSKHIYSVTIPGRCWWFEPGEWYTLQIGGAGQREYIDAVCECYGVQVEAAADGLGATRVDFREVEQNWVKDSNAVARFLATGDPRWKPNNFGRVVVAAKNYLDVANYYCDGTDDQTEIQAAIDYLANAFGGGMVELTEGQYNIAAAIDRGAANIIFAGKGAKTIISKSCDDYAIKSIGIDGTEIAGGNLRDMKVTRATADAYKKALIYNEYTTGDVLENLDVDGSYDVGIENKQIEGCVITKAVIQNCKNHGISIINKTEGSTLIDRGDCEDAATPPMFAGETVPYAPREAGTWARSNTVVHGGTFSWKGTASAGGLAWKTFIDSFSTTDMHGLSLNKSYVLGLWVYLLADANVAGSRSINVAVKDSTKAVAIGFEVIMDYAINEWRYYEVPFNTSSTTTGIYIAEFSVGGTGAADLIYIDDVSLYETDERNIGSKLINLISKNNRGSGIRIASSNNEISDVSTEGNYISGIEIFSGDKNQIGKSKGIDNGNLVDAWDCELAVPPAISGEVTNTLTQCTYARSAAQAYEGANSYLLTKAVAAGTGSTAYLTDNANTNDLHGLYAGQEYRFGAWVYIPSGGMTGAELTLVLRDYVAAWEETAQACALTYDAWQYVEVTKTLRAGSIGATFGFAIASTAANAETAYTDSLRLTPMGTGNLHNQNFYDAGTGTYTGV